MCYVKCHNMFNCSFFFFRRCFNAFARKTVYKTSKDAAVVSRRFNEDGFEAKLKAFQWKTNFV